MSSLQCFNNFFYFNYQKHVFNSFSKQHCCHNQASFDHPHLIQKPYIPLNNGAAPVAGWHRVFNSAEWIVWSSWVSWQDSALVSCHMNEFSMTALGYLNFATGLNITEGEWKIWCSASSYKHWDFTLIISMYYIKCIVKGLHKPCPKNLQDPVN